MEDAKQEGSVTQEAQTEPEAPVYSEEEQKALEEQVKELSRRERVEKMERKQRSTVIPIQKVIV